MFSKTEIRGAIAITGASSGIGEALALEIANSEVELYLCARRESELENVAQQCRERGAVVTTKTLDVTDEAKLFDWLEASGKNNPLDMVIFNAGIFEGVKQPKTVEDVTSARRIIDINFTSPIVGALNVSRGMINRGKGHLVFISSLAALAPLADAPTYSATKAGLGAFGLALREYLYEFGVRVTMVYPGHVQTAQAQIQNGSLPMLISKEVAAKRIVESIKANKSSISFPFPLRLAVFFLKLLPWRLQYYINKPLRFTVDKDHQHTKSLRKDL